MSDFAIRVEGLGKQYRIGCRQSSYRTLRETMADGANAALARLRGLAPAEHEEIIWALRDVSFEVQEGEVLGIIGRNGAGKTTLLKILSRITEPTEGYAQIHGRVGSLLEVGTGFHPELSGRENIYLNGAILGMRRAEIQRRFDEIVSFAEVEKFIDTPVKHYSSGMYMRLAFAVAAHLEPDILLIDEVLAVGDASFQNKCLSKMRVLTREGTTMLFVSHNLHLIEIVASQSLYLLNGTPRYVGKAGEALQLYLQELQKSHTDVMPSKPSDGFEVGDREDANEIFSVKVSCHNGSTELHPGEDLIITISYKSSDSSPAIHFNVSLWSEGGFLVTSADTRLAKPHGLKPQPEGTVTCRFPSPPLVSGKYSVRAYMLSELDWPLASFGWSDGKVSYFTVRPIGESLVTGMNWFLTHADYGVVRVPFDWEF